jgi:heme/copper-type cytochrome/quinol oxidase subunit 1
MSTIIPGPRNQSVRQAGTTAVVTLAPIHERYYARFFAAAVIALCLGGLQGIIQRLPGISDWLYAAGYGGHMITDLAQTHIIIVGAGTITLTALIYYVLPRILGRPIYSPALTIISFWFTVIGVYAFYFVLLTLGIIEGGMVRAGMDYYQARALLGPWHMAPEGIAASIMGIGYWTFIINVYLTIRTPKSWQGREAWIAKYMLMGVTSLFIGTIQGVYQVMPWSLTWLAKAGEAGEQIDPIAHAHINMVGGVTIALFGMCYFFIPRMTGRQIFSVRLANISFWLLTIGVLGFWLSLISLGLTEGNIIINQHVTYQQAISEVGPVHTILRAGFASLMGIGFWSTLANIFLTLCNRRREAEAYAPGVEQEPQLAKFIWASCICLLIATIQGVIQILPFAVNWLDRVGLAGDLITPLAHAQLNIIGSVGFFFMGFTYYLTPRLIHRPMFSQRLITLSFNALAIGITGFYLSLFYLGFRESFLVLSGLSFTAARAKVGLLDPILLSGFNAVIFISYTAYASNVLATIGRYEFQNYLVERSGIFFATIDRMTKVYPRAMSRNRQQLHRRARRTFVAEVIGGWLGLLGLGWFTSGRLALGALLWIIWMSIWVLVLGFGFATQSTPHFTFIFYSAPFYLGLPFISAYLAYMTYKHRGLKHK